MLSICVPTYNRAKELKKLFESIDKHRSDIQIVLCDDGSTDCTKKVVEEYREYLTIKYVYQENSGRSVALLNAIEKADEKYTMLMDSDDYFLPGAFTEIFKVIDELESLGSSSNVQSAVFGVELIKGESKTYNLPPSCISNFIAIQADYGNKFDLKELVKTDVIKSCLYDVPNGCRRVPTYLLWAKVASRTQCLSVSKAVAAKEYLPGGMTDRILYLKTTYSAPMVTLYDLVSESRQYKSSLYRWKCRILWARYSLHNKNFSINKYWHILIFPLAWLIYRNDLRNLKVIK